MTALSTLNTRVKSYVKNVPSLMATQALSTAAREFFLKTRAWTEVQDVTLDAGDYDFEPTMATGQEWVSIDWMKVNGNVIDPATFKIEPDFGRQSTPDYFGSNDAQSILVWPTPKEQVAIEVSLVLRPALNAKEVPDAQLALFAEPIIHGAAAELLEQRGYPWYDPSRVPFHMGKFESGIQDAHAAKLVSHTQASHAVRMRPMG
ncbi:MAG: hypothetical protein AAGI44_02325 [Pseudomonadota bacterium]